MSAALVGDLGARVGHFEVESFGLGDVDARRTRNDAQLGIRELEVLRLDVDMVAPPEAADLAGPLVESFRAVPSAGDHLRLPTMTNLDGPAMRAAVSRVLMAGAEGTADARVNKMLRTLQGLETTVANIQRQSALSVRF